MKILMVCLGNICRSPLAEGILKSKVNTDKITVDSAGTGGYHLGNPPDSRSIAIAKKHHIDISQQRCRQVSQNDFKKFDVIYAMDYANYNHLIQMAPNIKYQAKVRLLLEEIESPIKEVPDPYYGGADGFQVVFELIDEACDQIKLKFDTSP